MSELCVSHVLFAEADKATGMITASLGDVLSGEGVDDAATVFQQWGFLSIPAPPIPGVSGPEAVYIETGDVNVVIAGRSVRSGAIAGILKPGETCNFADGSQATMLLKADGSCIFYSTHDNTANGRSCFQSTGPAGWEFSWPWGRTIIDKSGWSTIHVGGASIHCGQLGLSGPFSLLADAGLTSYIALTAPLVRINGSLVSIGPDTGVAAPVAKATPLLAVLDALSAVLKALITTTPKGPYLLGAVPGVPVPDPTPVTGLVALVTTAITAIATAHDTIGSTSVVVT